ncbi:MAG: translation initiation factor IF-2, partial [Cytophagales bacterium]|nr:translation initiation factor IF-2 [Cytophaga sp.]
MAEEKMMRLSQVARKLNVGTSTIIDHLSAKGYEIENNPNAKITVDMYAVLSKEYEASAQVKKEASGLTIGKKHMGDLVIDANQTNNISEQEDEDEILIKNNNPVEEIAVKETTPILPAAEISSEEKDELTGKVTLQGIKVLGKIDLSGPEKTEKKPEKEKPVAKAEVKTEEPKKEEKTPEPVSEEPKKAVVAEVAKTPAEAVVTETPATVVTEKPEVKTKDPVAEKPPVVAPVAVIVPEVAEHVSESV